MSMRVLVITNDLSQGGAEKLLVSSLPLLKSKNLEVELLLLKADNSVPNYLTDLKNSGIPIHDLHAPNFYDPFSVFKIRRFLTSNSFDIVHVHLFPALYWASFSTFFLGRKPLMVYTEHSNHNKRRGKKYLKLAERITYGSYSAVIAITESVRQNLIEWIGQADKIVTIQNGVDLMTIQSAKKKSKIELCSELGFRYPKDQDTIMKACKLLGSNYHILFAGEGDRKEIAESLAVSYGVSDQVHFLGFRTDVYTLMKSVDLNILSSEYEGMSGVTLESLAAEVPFLGSNVPGISEIVPNEDFLFSPGNEKDLAERVSGILQNPDLYGTMVKEAGLYIKNFDMELMADRYLSLYEYLILHKT
jgi:glycosyltransferase involved in cell wall biosynthesis